MFRIFFMNLFGDSMIKQVQGLEKIIDFHMYIGDATACDEELNKQIKWVNEEQMDAIICQWENYDRIMSFKPLVPVYPVSMTAFDTCVILYLLQKELKSKGLEHYKRVVLGTYLPITVRLDVLEEMYNFELINPPWNDELEQGYFNALAKEGYDVVICNTKYVDAVRNSGMYAFHDDRIYDYLDFSLDLKRAIQQVAMGSQLQQTLDEFKNMLNNSFEAICILDREGRIKAYNEQAVGMFKAIEGDSYNGQYFPDMVTALDEDEFEDVLNKGKAYYSRIINVNNTYGMLNITPNQKDDAFHGAVVHFTTIQQIEKMESQVKSEFYQKGHFAKYRFDEIIGESVAITKSKKLAERFSKYNTSILIYGESGCGKELFAQSIHNSSFRNNQPFVAINCGSLPTNLLESELFGYVDGAFTGALKKGKKGLFEIANKGTIFLDEISEIDAQGQTRLLRVIEERSVMRIGDDKLIPIDVRIIAASNKNLLELSKQGKFREDLYYRLNVLTLTIPPLRERNRDVILLAQNFIENFGKRYNKRILLSEAAEEMLLSLSWDGNVRQLRNFCERLVIVADHKYVDEKDVREQIKGTDLSLIEKDMLLSTERLENGMDEMATDKGSISQAEKNSICNALEKTNGRREKAAKILGISKSTLWRKMKKYNLTDKY
ncbi:sigma 54-interacting transcriptional regulator [Fusibacter ferrireducens]|uniref:Sigma 54-interacting transcriptional regulator n=1 Tax=Fusibacter ferrireducens TaxID=2785058 RepID=A0ABR9ZVG5_9FIRM|nr:sigma 54-interacting transcriptional regulator [Fusibacter ferrireducens]MBF4694447.1 sigma 54-interacting transcriptional regulator [Fusibacter ferrireducens]